MFVLKKGVNHREHGVFFVIKHVIPNECEESPYLTTCEDSSSLRSVGMTNLLCDLRESSVFSVVKTY